MVSLSTRFTELLGLERPIVQAPIGSATSPALAAAVSEAGGLGTLAVTWREPETARSLVEATAARTERPFGVNVVLDPSAGGSDPGPLLDACLDAGAPVVSLSFGEPASHVERIHDADALALATVGSADEAASAVDAGVDAVVAQGWEAGGHVQSEVATMPLVPRVADAVPDAPVVAAGGIADGRGVAAALCLGADAAWLGTRFVATEEAAVHDAYAERVADAAETETVYGEPYDRGWPDQPHRTLANETTAQWEQAGRPAEDRPGEGEVIAREADGTPIERYEDALATPEVDGDVEEVPLYAGQSAGLVADRQPAGEVVRQLTDEARRVLSGEFEDRE